MASKDRTYGYYRYSTEGQAEDDAVSPDVQIKRIERTCEAKGWNLNGYYKDEAESGDDISRNGLWSMLDDVATGKIDRVVVAYRDRLMRDRDLLSLVVKYFATFKTQIWFSDMGMGLTGEEDESMAYSLKMVLDALGNMDEIMLRIIRTKTKDALEYKAKEQGITLGRRVAGFHTPDKRKLVPTEQLLEMEQLHLAGESIKTLARSQRFVVEGGKKEGEPLTASQIKRRLRNVKEWREGTLADRLRGETAAMRERYERLLRAKAERQKELEAMLRGRLPPEIRSTRL